jgi:hypothetical protein
MCANPGPKTAICDVTAGKLGEDPIFMRADGGKWGKSHQLRPMMEACKRAKIKPAVSFHVLRTPTGQRWRCAACRWVSLPSSSGMLILE